ncbi:Acyl-CoA-binding domain-containing protein 4 [Platanthera zijinensis]|uniref:Acyl-CoA-binding domain-containing protein 4 n=1 Tax=Platanthera zijinensis TaxID=2320716 RepID=A0AAP0BV47_9ASPA
MASTEAMRLFVKILEEEDPAWYSRVPEPIVKISSEIHKSKLEPSGEKAISSGTSFPESKHISIENGDHMETQDKDIIMEGLGAIGVYDNWVAPPISGHHPKPRYEHGAAVVKDKMYIFGGNHNGRYLSDLQVLDLRSLMWSKIDAKVSKGLSESSTPAQVAPCAGHSLISWDNKILSVAGHAKDPSKTVTVKEFDLQTLTWSDLRTYGKPPISRGGQSVTLVGTTLVIFGGQDAKRSLLNDLHVLDLETMTWDDIDAIGTPPSPRSDHAAACHAERYLLIFGGGSHATCFNDLYVLDLHTMEWSRPRQQGVTPGPRAGHAGVKVGENWFIVGGGDNKNGVSETLVLHMSTLVWSVVTTVQGRVPLASEGLTVVLSTCNGEDYLVSFGGYNGRYSNEVYVLKPSYKSDLPSRMIDKPTSENMSVANPTTNVSRDLAPESEAAQDGKITEIMMDNVDPGASNMRTESSAEHVIVALKTENEELEAALNRERLQNFQLKQELAEVEIKNVEISKAWFLFLFFSFFKLSINMTSLFGSSMFPYIILKN